MAGRELLGTQGVDWHVTVGLGDLLCAIVARRSPNQAPVHRGLRFRSELQLKRPATGRRKPRRPPSPSPSGRHYLGRSLEGGETSGSPRFCAGPGIPVSRRACDHLVGAGLVCGKSTKKPTRVSHRQAFLRWSGQREHKGTTAKKERDNKEKKNGQGAKPDQREDTRKKCLEGTQKLLQLQLKQDTMQDISNTGGTMKDINVALHQKLPGRAKKGRDITLGNEPIQATRGRYYQHIRSPAIVLSSRHLDAVHVHGQE